MNQYKRVYRYRSMGGDTTGNRFHAALQNKFNGIRMEFYYWTSKLAEYSTKHGVSITINKEDIEKANVIEPLLKGVSKFDVQVEWATENAPIFFDLLRIHAQNMEEAEALGIQYDTDIPIHVSSSSDGPIVISHNNCLMEETASDGIQ